MIREAGEKEGVMDEKAVQTGAAEELDAMRAVAEALAKVDATSARRVLQWASERFGVVVAPSKSPKLDQSRPLAGEPDPGQDLGTFFAEAAPKSGPEKALVVGYYQQVIQGTAELDAQALNAELKHLGHKVANITATLSLLINQSPSLLIQTKKMGRGQQARKRYKLTNAGIVRVREMLARAKGGEAGED